MSLKTRHQDATRRLLPRAVAVALTLGGLTSIVVADSAGALPSRGKSLVISTDGEPEVRHHPGEQDNGLHTQGREQGGLWPQVPEGLAGGAVAHGCEEGQGGEGHGCDEAWHCQAQGRRPTGDLCGQGALLVLRGQRTRAGQWEREGQVGHVGRAGDGHAGECRSPACSGNHDGSHHDTDDAAASAHDRADDDSHHLSGHHHDHNPRRRRRRLLTRRTTRRPPASLQDRPPGLGAPAERGAVPSSAVNRCRRGPARRDPTSPRAIATAGTPSIARRWCAPRRRRVPRPHAGSCRFGHRRAPR